jgi:hypothetical protein
MKPKKLDEMLRFAEYFSKDFPYVRVDLYHINDEKIIFGEFTFYRDSGMGGVTPFSWDEKLGNLVDIDMKKKDTARI